MSDDKASPIVKTRPSDDEYIRWTLRLRVQAHWVDWELFESNSWEMDGTPLFWKRGEKSGQPGVSSIDEAECEISGFVKWDGCNEMHIDGSHNCGAPSARGMLDAIAWAMSEAWLAMTERDPDLVGTLPDGREP